MRRFASSRRFLAAAFVAAGALSATAQAAPTESLHSLDWYVHEDLIGAGRDLDYFRQLIEDRLAEAEIMVQGYQGPIDTPCCVAFDAVSVTTFSGAGLDIIETPAERDAVLGGPEGGYLVQSVWYCPSFSTSIVGCAGLGADTFVVSLDAEDIDILPVVMAHERGHNSGLYHATNDYCDLMAGARGGGCLSASECTSFIAKADSSGGSCSCLGDSVGDPPLADATACSDDFGSGLCSGGVCGETSGPAGTRILAAAGSEDPSTAVTDDALHQSALAGGWETLGAIGAGVEATGLAYDPGRDVVFAIAPQAAGNDQLVTLDPATGAKTATIDTLDHQGITALAYDPAGDRLFAIYADAEIFGGPVNCGSDPVCVSTLLEIDPDDGDTTVYGELNALIVAGAVQGLAWDSAAGELYGSTAAGLFTIGLGCDGVACSDTSQVDNLYRKPSSLTYDPETDTLYRQGTMSSRTEFDSIDPASGDVEPLIGVDGFTAGGLAVIPVPEPEGWLMLGSGLALLALLGSRRGRFGMRTVLRAAAASAEGARSEPTASEAGWAGLCPARDHKTTERNRAL
jgi:hypothetical protein